MSLSTGIDPRAAEPNTEAYTGGTSESSAKNPNDFQVSLKGLKPLVVTGDVDRDHRGCEFETNFKVTPPVLAPSIKVIGGRESVSFKDGSITLTNDPKINQIACQGATVTLSYVLK